jgi:hypothetical protein
LNWSLQRRGVQDTKFGWSRLLLRGRTNFIRSLWKFNSVFNPALQMADHARIPRFELPLPTSRSKPAREDLYIHRAQRGRRNTRARESNGAAHTLVV